MSRPDFPTDFLASIERAVLARSGTQRGDEVIFRCPLPDHADEHPSARFNVKRGVWYCPVCNEGGGALKLAGLLGIDAIQGGEGVFVSPPGSFGNSETSLTVAELAAAKGLDAAFVRSCGVSDVTINATKVVRMIYFNPDRSEGAIRFRLCLEKGAPDLRFRWKGGSKLRLYGLDRLPAGGDIWLVEGESDCWALWQAGEPAVGVPGASNWNDKRDADHLERFERIFAIVEPDQGGETLREQLLGSRLRDRIHLVTLTRWNVKDASALFLDDAEAFKERLGIAQLAAIPLADVRSISLAKEVREAEASSRHILDAEDVMGVVRKAITDYGYRGNTRPAEIAYLALASTATDDPVNIAFIAVAAAGKNAAIDAVRDFFPEDAIFEIEAGSPTTLIYTDQSFEHRCVLYSEADSIPDEGAVASAVRNLAWKKRLVYDVTEKDEVTGKFKSRRIEKAGPTSLITTSTRSLAKQLGTRVFEVGIDDGEQQTREVMRAHAAREMPGFAVDMDLAPLVAFQTWMRLAGARRVVIPFAAALSDLLPARQVRMRRDSKQILAFIKTVAFLYQCAREKTGDGAVIATIADYAAVRDLLAPTLDSIATEGLTDAVRGTVEAVPAEGTISLSDLASTMKVAVSTADYRVRKALAGGWIVNQEDRRGHPKKLARGAPLPEHVSAMPDPQTLERAWKGGSEEVSEFPNEPRGETDTPSPPPGERLPDVQIAMPMPMPNGHVPESPSLFTPDEEEWITGAMRTIRDFSLEDREAYRAEVLDALPDDPTRELELEALRRVEALKKGDVRA